MKDKTDETKPPVRRFRARNMIVMPQGLITGPGATNMRLDPDQIVELTPDAIQRHERFVSGRVRAGDLEELVERTITEPVDATSPNTATASKRATRDGDKESGR